MTRYVINKKKTALDIMDIDKTLTVTTLTDKNEIVFLR